MIFVTVGAQMPFDRLVRVVDAWAKVHDRHDVFAQIGDTRWRPSHLEWTRTLSPGEFRARAGEADVIVTHAGMGTILTALECRTPVLAMPRRGVLRETRNDHQVGTARAFAQSEHIAVAWDETELLTRLDDLDTLTRPPRIASHAPLPLLSALRTFIRDGVAAPGVSPIAPITHSTEDSRRLVHPATQTSTTRSSPRRAA